METCLRVLLGQGLSSRCGPCGRRTGVSRIVSGNRAPGGSRSGVECTSTCCSRDVVSSTLGVGAACRPAERSGRQKPRLDGVPSHPTPWLRRRAAPRGGPRISWTTGGEGGRDATKLPPAAPSTPHPHPISFVPRRNAFTGTHVAERTTADPTPQVRTPTPQLRRAAPRACVLLVEPTCARVRQARPIRG